MIERSLMEPVFICGVLAWLIGFAEQAHAEIVPHIPAPQVHVVVPKVHVPTPHVHVVEPKIHVPTAHSTQIHPIAPQMHLPSSRSTAGNIHSLPDGAGLSGGNARGQRPNLTASGLWHRGHAPTDPKPAIANGGNDKLSVNGSTQKQASGSQQSNSAMKSASAANTTNNAGVKQTIFDPSCYSGGNCGGCMASNTCVIASYPSNNNGIAACVANCGRIPSLPTSVQCGVFGICGPVAAPPPVPATPVTNPSPPANNPAAPPNPPTPVHIRPSPIQAGLPLSGGMDNKANLPLAVGIVVGVTTVLVLYRFWKYGPPSADGSSSDGGVDWLDGRIDGVRSK